MAPADDDFNAADTADTADDALLAALKQALGPVPMPAGLIERASELVVLADLDAELLGLAEEPSGELVGTRGDRDAGTGLVFTGRGGLHVVEVDVVPDGLIGLVIGVRPDHVVLQRADGTESTSSVDQLGRFAFTQPAPGPARICVAAGDVPPMATDWFAI